MYGEGGPLMTPALLPLHVHHHRTRKHAVRSSASFSITMIMMIFTLVGKEERKEKRKEKKVVAHLAAAGMA